MRRVADVGPLTAFIVYHSDGQDEKHCHTLEKHLSVLTRQRELVIRHERLVTAGQDFRAELSQMLDSADLVILLLTPDFIASNFCYAEQMERAMQRHKENRARVIPVFLRPCYWTELPVARLLALPSSTKAITSFKDQESAWARVARGIHAAVKDLQQSVRTQDDEPLYSKNSSANKVGGSETTSNESPMAPVVPAPAISPLMDTPAVREAYRLINDYHRGLFHMLRQIMKGSERHLGDIQATGWSSSLFDMPVRRDRNPLVKWACDFQPLEHCYVWWATEKLPLAGSCFVSAWHCGDDAVENFRTLMPQDEPTSMTLAPAAKSRTTIALFVKAVIDTGRGGPLPDWEYLDTVIASDEAHSEASWYEGVIHESRKGGIIRYGGFQCDVSEVPLIRDVSERLVTPLGALIDSARKP